MPRRSCGRGAECRTVSAPEQRKSRVYMSANLCSVTHVQEICIVLGHVCEGDTNYLRTGLYVIPRVLPGGAVLIFSGRLTYRLVLPNATTYGFISR